LTLIAEQYLPLKILLRERRFRLLELNHIQPCSLLVTLPDYRWRGLNASC
jgi:hypothetical protein